MTRFGRTTAAILGLVASATIVGVGCGGDSSSSSGIEGATIPYSEISGGCMEKLDTELFDALIPPGDDSESFYGRKNAADDVLTYCKHKEIVAYIDEKSIGTGGSGDVELVRLWGIVPPTESQNLKGGEWDPSGERTVAACKGLAADVGKDADEYRYFCGTSKGAGS